MVSEEAVLEWLKDLHGVYAENKQYLTDLDSAIGDADHGINMDRGFSQVVKELENNAPKGIEAILKSAAVTLIKTVGGAAGPLYGTFFLRAAAVCTGKDMLQVEDVVLMVQAGLEGVVHRGKAALNDKTMVDALDPAFVQMERVLTGGAGSREVLRAAAGAARQGMENTIPLQARKGRAAYLGERSIGHLDPGAASVCLLIESMARVFGKSGL